MTSQIDLRELRNAFGTFMTGVTVVTTHEADGTPRGFTANSFTSVSLDPPLLSICIGKSADSIKVFNQSLGFAINILSEKQIETSSLFASKRPDKFTITRWQNGPAGHPVLDSVCAWFDCKLEQRIDAGDHVILIGRVEGFDYNDQNGLGYVRGGYVTLGLEQAAVSAAGHDTGVVVGALVDCNGKILLRPSPTSGRLQLVASGLDQQRGSISRLKTILDELNIGAVIKSLYAVFENEETERQFIFYRAIADHEDTDNSFYAQDEIPWDKLDDKAVVTMVKRYFEESHDQRYGVYFGNHNSGTVQHSDEVNQDR
jgi:flavin reductase (DIM6/NTAB) family NADH-FMN oxidoreductase RutF